MGYDVCVNNSYGHRAFFFLSAICRRSHKETQGDHTAVVCLRRYRTDPVRCPYVLIQNARRPNGSRRVSADC